MVWWVQTSIFICGLSILSLTSVEGYNGYVIFVWVYGIFLGRASYIHRVNSCWNFEIMTLILFLGFPYVSQAQFEDKKLWNKGGTRIFSFLQYVHKNVQVRKSVQNKICNSIIWKLYLHRWAPLCPKNANMIINTVPVPNERCTCIDGHHYAQKMQIW